MKKLILFLFLFTGYLQAQTLPSPTYNKTTTNTLVVKTPATVTSVNFLAAVELDGSISKIAPSNIIIPTPDATTTTKGIVKLAGDLGGTADLPTTPTAIHKTGNESRTGNLTISNLSTPSALLLQNGGSSAGILSVVNASSLAAFTGTTGSAGTLAALNTTSSGTVLSLNSSSTGKLFSGLNNNVETSFLDKFGIFTLSGANLTSETASTIASFDASKNVKSLPTATYPSLTELSYVKGATSSLQTQLNGKQNTLTNPITGTGTTDYLPIFSGTSSLSNSSLRHSSIFLEVVSRPFRYINDLGNAVGFHGDEFAALGTGSKMNLVTYVYGPTNSHKVIIDGSIKTVVNSAGFEVSGNAKVSSLAGTGTRQLQADSSGNISAYSAILNTNTSASSLTLNSDGIVNYYVFGGTTATWTLPTPASSTTKKISMINAGTGTVTVNTNGGANVLYNGGSTTNTYGLIMGSNVELYSDGSKWIVL